MPKFVLRSDAPPSLYSVPKKEAENEGKEKKKRDKVVLSTTTKSEKRSKQKKGDADMATPGEEKLEPEDAKDDKDAEKKKEEEPSFEVLHNPARVTLGQLQVLSFSEDTRYLPVKPVCSHLTQCYLVQYRQSTGSYWSVFFVLVMVLVIDHAE